MPADEKENHTGDGNQGETGKITRHLLFLCLCGKTNQYSHTVFQNR